MRDMAKSHPLEFGSFGGLVIASVVIFLVYYLRKDPLLKIAELNLLGSMTGKSEPARRQSDPNSMRINIDNRRIINTLDAASIASFESTQSSVGRVRPPTPFNHKKVSFASLESV